MNYEEAAVRALHRAMLEGWNRRDAAACAAPFAVDALVIGFDGSEMLGRTAIAEAFRQIFAHHETGKYVWKVREVRLLASEVALLRAVVGMVPAGRTELDPALNAIQVLVAVRSQGQWRIASFQNTPAQFHGRPEMVESLTRELAELLA